jgi:hypothetical protein
MIMSKRTLSITKLNISKLNDTQHKTLSIMNMSKRTLSITKLNISKVSIIKVVITTINITTLS